MQGENGTNGPSRPEDNEKKTELEMNDATGDLAVKIEGHRIKFNIKDKFRVCRDIMYNELDGEIVLYNNKNQYYYSLNEMGTEIFDMIEKKMSFSEIEGSLYTEYGKEIERTDLRSDIAYIVADLISEKIIEKEK